MEGGGRRMKPAPLKISRESRMIRKAPAPAPSSIQANQQRQPVIIHTYSPKVIETEAHNFMWLVQRLTGSSDTIQRCQKNKPASMPSSPRSEDGNRRSSNKPAKRVREEVEEEEQEYKKRIKAVALVKENDSEEETDRTIGEEFQIPAAFKVEHLLLSPTSSSDSGLCFNSHNRVCAPMVASPKSPLVNFDASASLSFQIPHGDQVIHPFATSSALATNSDSFTHSGGNHAFPWSPTPAADMNDFPLMDLWAPPSESHGIAPSPYSRFLGTLQSPAAYIASNFLKDSNFA